MSLDPPLVAIVDHHPLVRDALSRIAEEAITGRVVASVGTVGELERRRTVVDLCIIDPAQPGVGGPSTIAALRRGSRAARVAVVTDRDDPDYALVCHRRGASGFVSKRAPSATVGEMLVGVMQGRTTFPSSTWAANPADPILLPLTEREYEVLRLLSDGLRVTDIARRLDISVKTVSTHKVRLQDKLGVRTTAQIVPRAAAVGLLP